MTINSSSIVFGCMNATMIKNEVILPIDLNGWQVKKKNNNKPKPEQNHGCSVNDFSVIFFQNIFEVS